MPDGQARGGARGTICCGITADCGVRRIDRSTAVGSRVVTQARRRAAGAPDPAPPPGGPTGSRGAAAPRTYRGRTSAVALVAVMTLALVSIGAGLLWRSRHVTVPLLTSTVGVDYRGDLQAVAPSARPRWVDDTRALLPLELTTPRVSAARRQGVDQLTWLAAGTVPGAGTPYQAMARTMLLDLHTLTLPGGAQIAGAPGPWHYVWPRDASFGAVAFARTGHVADAVDLLAFLQRVQAADGSFQARYLPDGSGPPDDRGLQEDGPGWALWATEQTVRAAPAGGRPGILRRLGPLVERSGARLLDRIDASTALPRPSEDYWETPQDHLTLGIAAPSLAGLSSAANLARTGGQRDLAARYQRAAAAMRAAIERTFGPHGYPRTPDGGPDAAVTFLLPPFQAVPLPGSTRARSAAVKAMMRPAGGLAPGADWKSDGISWTPETALFALSDASTGDTVAARGWLTWLAAHRTDEGSLSEKVLADGRPAGPAPLAWSAALVVLAISAIQHAGTS